MPPRLNRAGRSQSPERLNLVRPLAQRRNLQYVGTHVVSGAGRAVVTHTGRHIAYGAIAERLRQRLPPHGTPACGGEAARCD